MKNGGVIETGIKCEQLGDDNLCEVYQSRPEWCMTATEMIKKELLQYLPDSCGYKQGG
jgi:uncharacterized cysteine cluster protein YcgN (CxxCxxCC family)